MVVGAAGVQGGDEVKPETTPPPSLPTARIDLLCLAASQLGHVVLYVPPLGRSVEPVALYTVRDPR